MTRANCGIALIMVSSVILATPCARPRQSVSHPVLTYPDSRRLDPGTEFANVGALITVAEKNDMGVPEGILGKCTGIHVMHRPS